MQAEVNEPLAKKQLVSASRVQQSTLDAQQLATRHDIAEKQLASRVRNRSQARLAVQQSERRSGARDDAS